MRARKLLWVAPALALLLAYAAPLPARLSRPHSAIVLDAEGQWMRVRITPDDGGMLRIPVRRAELPEVLVAAVIDFEDRRFRWHPGVDPIALLRAAYLNVTEGRVVSGGSTITMQIARMLERRPRTLGAKLVEIARAVQLELHYSKDELLELYFNLAPYGGNLEGVGSAAYYYYAKPVERLSLDEAATLAAIPNAPGRLDPVRGRERLIARRDEVLRRMAAGGVVSEDDAAHAMRLPLGAARRATPFVAPHLSEKVMAAHPDAPRLRTAIDRELQLRVERLLAEHVARLEAHGITNGAVVVIENATRKVRAYAGSRSFFDAAHDGQVDGADAPRSPGSTLKPFVYALALDRGLIGTQTLLEDVPVSFKDWVPSNFDGKFHGLVPARDALARSLNIPAVKLSARLEPHGLVELLGRAGARSVVAAPGRYGLATVLGGVDLSLLELTNLYSSLAEGGRHRPYKFLEDDPEGEAIELFSPGAAYLVTDILTDVTRPELPDAWQDAVSIPRVAWKTGTSYGRRDAWTVGVSARWSVGVWVGNFDATGVPELVGVESAAPLFFAIAQTLPGIATDAWIPRPEGLEPREVCALSGARPGPGCAHTRSELALSQAPRESCALHQVLLVDDDTGARLCPRCRAGRHAHEETHVVWPAAALGVMRANGLVTTPVPEHDARCAHGLGGEGPEIRSPLDGDEYLVRPGVPLELQKIALLASVASGNRLYWFVDGALEGEVAPGEALMMDLEPGSHRVVAMDGEGRRSGVSISVRAAE